MRDTLEVRVLMDGCDTATDLGLALRAALEVCVATGLPWSVVTSSERRHLDRTAWTLQGNEIWTASAVDALIAHLRRLPPDAPLWPKVEALEAELAKVRARLRLPA